MSKPSAQDLANDIILLHNQLDISTRTGEYGTKKHMDMYAKFKKLVRELQKRATTTDAEQSQLKIELST